MTPTRRTTLAMSALLLMWGASCGEDGASAADPATTDGGDTGSTDAADIGERDAADAAGEDAAELDVAPDAPAPPLCFTDLAPGEVEVFYDGFPSGVGGGSEGVAFGADGRLVVTAQDALWSFDASGTRTQLAEVPSALGLAPTDDGFVVASIGESNVPGVLDGGVYYVGLDGTVTLWVDGMESPNFVAVLADGSALISDDFDTRVFRVTSEGEVTTVLATVPSPNGMGYSPDGAWLYVVSTFTPIGELTRYPVDALGLPDEAQGVVLTELGQGSTPDGLAIGASGDIYVAANIRNELVRVDAATGDREVVATGLGTPASLAFGAGEGFDPCSVYVTQLFGSKVLRVAIGEPGAPLRPFAE